MNPVLIASSNQNPVYMRFSELQQEACRHLGLDFMFCVSGSDEWRLGERTVRLPSLEGVPDVFVSQVARYIIPSFFPEREFIVGDIDMLILNRRLVGRLLRVLEGSNGIVFMDSDTYYNVLRFPCCYYMGKGRAFAEVLGLEDPDWSDCEQLIRRIWARGEGWTGDEYFFTETAMLASARIPVSHYNRRVNGLLGRRRKLKGRINRSDFKYTRLGLMLGLYYDVHCVRPIEDHIPRLRHVFNYVYSGLDGRRYLRYELSRILFGRLDLFPDSLRHPA